MESEVKVIVSPCRTEVRMVIDGKDVDWSNEENLKAAYCFLLAGMSVLGLKGTI